MVVIDTSVIIDHLRCLGRKRSVFDILSDKFAREEMAVSMPTIQELYEGKSTLDSQRKEEMLAIVGSIEILPYSYDVAKNAGEIIRDLNSELEFADAAIAASCLVNDCELATLNIKDFRSVPGLKLVDLETFRN